MDKTIRLFDKDAYAVEFTSEMISCEKVDGKYEVILAETLFFPEQGGQSPDKGILGGVEVIDVQNREGVIIHFLNNEPQIDKENITGKIEWKHRFSNMQQHSGEHIFSGIINKKYGYDNVGFHLSDNVVTLDTSGPLTKEQLEEIEEEANQIIIENHPVKVYFPSEEELDNISYRCKDGIEGDIRLVEIDGVDTCACCAPHVMSTCQVGLLKVVDFQNYKGGTRIFILCGSRAFEFCRKNDEIIKQITNELSCQRENILEFINKIKDDKREVIGRLKSLQIKELEKEITDVNDANSIKIFTEVDDANVIRNAVNTLVKEHRGYCGIFSGEEGNYRYIIGSEKKDCLQLLEKIKEVGAKGGGSSAMIQGTINISKEEIEILY